MKLLMGMKKELTCPHCGYRWIPRVENTKRCARCGAWLVNWRLETK